jgi:hypothetical protein
VLEELGVAEALLNAVSAGREGRVYLILVRLLYFDVGILFWAAEAKGNVLWCRFRL